jgi:hypothetical protein
VNEHGLSSAFAPDQPGGLEDVQVMQATATGTPAPPPAPPAATVRFKASDGEPVTAQYTAAADNDAPAIVLLHEIRGGPSQWDELVPHPFRDVLAIDRRCARTL